MSHDPASGTRFPPAVFEALTAAGWSPGRDETAQAREWSLLLAASPGPTGACHTVVPAATAALAEFGGLRIAPVADGEQVAACHVHLDPRHVRYTVAILAALADVVGVPLTPIGVEADSGGILAIDANGRVFCCDHSGDWYLGASIDEALITLLLGREPARLREDGSW